MKHIILASASPRRKELMSLITDDFEIRVEETNEREVEEKYKDRGPYEVSMNVARVKAEAVWNKMSAEEQDTMVVVAADTSVVLDNVIMGKPSDKDDAVNMLTNLSGRKHSVITGVWIIDKKSSHGFYEDTHVYFADLDDYQKDLIQRYTDSEDPYDKAGAYGIQNGGALLVDKIDGDYFNVVGLPVKKLARELE